VKYKNQIRRQLHLVAILVLLGVSLLTACGQSEPETFKVGFITSAALQVPNFEGFVEAMTELGYVEGENITYVGYWEAVNDPQKYAEANRDPVPLAQELVAADVDLIVAATTPSTQAAYEASEGTDIAIVFTAVTDPVAAGFIKDYARPGLRATGVRYGMPGNAQDSVRLEWLVKAIPGVKRVHAMYNPDSALVAPSVSAIEQTAPELGIELVHVHVHSDEEADAAWENIPDDIDAIFALPSLESYLSLSRHPEVMTRFPVATSTRYRLETEGALLAYGSDPYVNGRAMARLADQILQGTAPGDLPVETPEFFLFVNLKAAATLGIEIPDDVVRQAYVVVREGD
jgi:putative ABC transport system substrate-binding protein